MTIDSDDVVKSPRPLDISIQSIKNFKGIYLHPAQIQPNEIQKLLSHFSSGQAFDHIKALLVDNKNNPLRSTRSVQAIGNKMMQRLLLDKQYHFVYSNNMLQLWEVKIKSLRNS